MKLLKKEVRKVCASVKEKVEKNLWIKEKAESEKREGQACDFKKHPKKEEVWIKRIKKKVSQEAWFWVLLTLSRLRNFGG